MLPDDPVSLGKLPFLPPKESSHRRDDGSRWTFDAVQARLVEAWGFKRRLPGDGGWPFANDGPWHLIVADQADRNEAVFAGHPAGSMPRLPLRSAEVDRMHEALDWIAHVRPEDVRVVAAGIADLERSGHRIAWSEIAPRIGLRSKYGRLLGPRPLMMRYRRAIDAIVRALNGGNLDH